MSDVTGGKDGDGSICGDIKREKELKQQKEEIFRSWVEGDSPDRIAKRMRLPVRIVYGYLKEMQKERIAEQGEGRYGQRREL